MKVQFRTSVTRGYNREHTIDVKAHTDGGPEFEFDTFAVSKLGRQRRVRLSPAQDYEIGFEVFEHFVAEAAAQKYGHHDRY